MENKKWEFRKMSKKKDEDSNVLYSVVILRLVIQNEHMEECSFD